jgi:hypothetical protein
MKLTKKQIAANERAEAIAKLREWLKPGDTLYTVCDHVSQSGMRRHIRLVIMPRNSRESPLHPNYSAALATGRTRAPRGDGIIMDGCGMDMGFALVYSVGRAMFPDGFGVEGELNGRKVRPRSRKHAAALVAKGAAFRGRNRDASGWDNDGGYALKHSWL